MGKEKAKRHFPRKQLSAGTQSHEDMDCAETEMGDNDAEIGSTVRNLVEEFQCGSPEQQECCCHTVSNLVTSPEARNQLISAEIVRIIGPLLLHESLSLRNAALGSLRNFTVEGGVEICDKMVKHDCMTPLVGMLQKMCSLTGEAAKILGAGDINVITQAMHLLLNLCESNDTAVQIFNSQQLWPMLLQFLQFKPESEEDCLNVAAARCLYAVSDSNPEIIGKMDLSEAIRMLSSNLLLVPLADVRPQEKLLQLLLIGVLQNISGGHFSDVPSEILNKILLDLEEILAVNVQRILEDVLPLSTSAMNAQVNEARFQEIQSFLSAQQVSLEIVANLCCSNDDDDWEDDVCSDTSSDDIAEATTESDMTADSDAAEVTSKLSTDIRNVIFSNNMIQKVVESTFLPSEDTCNHLQQNQYAGKIWDLGLQTHSHGLLCLSNLLDVAGSNCTIEAQLLVSTWSHLAQLSRNPQVTSDAGRLEDVTRALRAVVKRLCEDKAPQLLEVTENDLGFLSDLCLNCPQPAVRVNAVGIASAVGCSLVKQGQPQHVIMKPLGQLLTEVCKRDTELHIVAEALDAIFDVFAEDETDPVATDINLIGTLVSLAPVLKSKVKQLKGNLGEHHGIITTARTNLVRFIKYKRQRLLMPS